ncbi:MAG: YHS domain-containing (seleno)protein [Bacteroidota bacterium]
MERSLRLIMLLLLVVASMSAAAQNSKYSSTGDEVAFDGNDLTAYFENKVVQGSEDYQLEYDGLTLRFATEENMWTFKSNPEKYIPAYNGWCATAVANGKLYKPDYSHYKLQDGKLLFFEVRAFFNGKTAWNKDPDKHKLLADEKFVDLLPD